MLLIFIFGWFLIKDKSQAQERTPKILKTVSIEKIQKGTIQEKEDFFGIVQGENRIKLAPKISGRITKIYVQEGQFVHQGELIALINGNELIGQSVLAQENVSANKKSLQKTKKFYSQKVTEAKVEEEAIKKNYQLAKKDSNKNNIDKTKKTWEVARESLKSAQRMRDLQIQLSKNQLRLSEQQNLVSQIQASNARLLAPFSGVITKKYLNSGSLTSPSMPIVALTKSQQKEVIVFIPGNLIAKISIGQVAQIRKNNQLNETILGKIKTISPVSNQTIHKSKVTISLEEKNSLNLGEMVNISLVIHKKNNTLIVPLSAIRKDYYDNIIFIAKNGLAKKRIVTLGTIDRNKVEIISGIQSGDFVITHGQQYLNNNDNILIK